jgi:hypothetical protein
MAAQQAELELVNAVVGDRLRDEATEARVDAVGVLGRRSTSARAASI